MKILKILLVLLILAAVAGVIAGLVLPSEYEVEESLVIDAPAAAIHPYVDDLKRWEEWASWYQGPQKPETTYAEVSSGANAHMSWKDDSGSGELTIASSDPAKGVTYRMEFIMSETERYPADGEIRYEPAGEGKTKVTWSTKGEMNKPIVGPLLIALLLKKGMRSDFRKGLEGLKKRAETAAK